ncbi:MAG: hypothetical protein ACJAR2_002239 [Ilumatobacter sp.]|jgi:hypothetical protein
MSCRSSSSHRFFRTIAAAIGASVLLTACFTGERPTLEEQESAPVVSTGNAEIDTVLGLLDSVGSSEFTAGYQIDTKFNTVSSTGLVVLAAGQRRSVTVENDERSVRFIVDASDELTCDLITTDCEVGLNDARISDTQLPHTFYGPAFAARLRADADRRIGDPAVYEKVIAGQAATCVDVVVAGGTKTYCALQSGSLAEFIGADVNIELTSYSPEPDATKFSST